MNKITESLYNELIAKDKNFMFSPYSLNMALSMVMEGAVGDTLAEMQDIIGDPPKHLDAETLKVANAIWTKCVLDDDWRRTITNFYGATVRNVKGMSGISIMNTINKWCRDNTDNKIDKILSRPPDEEIKLMLTNAIHFKDNWTHQFKEKNTKDDKFYVSDTDSVTVKMMTRSPGGSGIRYGETENTQVLEMPYATKGEALLSMVMILPKSRTGRVTIEDINSMSRSLYGSEVHISIPKIKMECSYDLSKSLKAMMPRVFSEISDLSKIYDQDAEPTLEGLKIDQVLQKTYVDINEEGTEAAAVTYIGVRALCSSMMPSPPKIFRADHPYVFMIRDKRTSEILFLGGVFDAS